MAVLVRTHPQFLFAPHDRRLSTALTQNAITTTGPLSVVPPPWTASVGPLVKPAPGGGRHRASARDRSFIVPPGTTRHRAERNAVAGSGIWSAVFWQDTSERVTSTFAATLLSEWTANTASAMFGLNLVTVDWRTSLGLAGGAAVASLLKALAASGVGDPQSASLLRRVRWTAPPGRHEKV